MLRIGSVCTGYGGLDMAVQSVIGGHITWVADPNPGAAQLLAHHYPDTPNLGDITRTNWADVPPVDVLVGGYPCQPFSLAGKRKGTEDDRHIWPHIADAIRVLRPRLAVFENVSGHLSLGFGTVLRDLAALGFDAEWCTLRASDIGAAHRRERLFCAARPAEHSGTATDTINLGEHRDRPHRPRRHEPAARHLTTTDAQSDGRDQGRPQPAGQQRGSDAPPGSAPDWGVYTAAISRWERAIGRPAPRPTDSLGRLSRPFVEWLMGLPAGHVTAVPGLSRTAQLRLLGNGVIPDQGSAALRVLLDRSNN